jgi:hypothetical protein
LVNVLDGSLQLAMDQIPECVAIGYVDIATKMLLSMKTLDSLPQEALEPVSAATSDLFQGTSAMAIETIFKRAVGIENDTQHQFQEIVVFSDNFLHIFMRCRKNIDHVLVFVCRGSANIGMVIAKSRIALSSVDGVVGRPFTPHEAGSNKDKSDV